MYGFGANVCTHALRGGTNKEGNIFFSDQIVFVITTNHPKKKKKKKMSEMDSSCDTRNKCSLFLCRLTFDTVAQFLLPSLQFDFFFFTLLLFTQLFCTHFIDAKMRLSNNRIFISGRGVYYEWMDERCGNAAFLSTKSRR